MLGLECGEKVMYKFNQEGSEVEKINSRWVYGSSVGVRRRSNEVIVITPDAIMEARSINRMPIQERWGEDCVQGVQWAP